MYTINKIIININCSSCNNVEDKQIVYFRVKLLDIIVIKKV